MNFLKTSFLTVAFLSLGVSSFAQIVTSCVEAIVTSDEGDELTLCLGDGESDRIRFSSSPQASPFGYIVVDENDLIVFISSSNFIEFENIPEGNYRVFSVSYIGQLLGEVGDNYLETQLGSFCFQLSSNSITVSNQTPVGGTVSTVEGEDEITLCVADDIANVRAFATSTDFTPYTFVVTDENNIMLNSSTDGIFDFSNAPEGICRVWGVAHQGNFIGQIGENILEANLASVCFDLSDNAVTINRLVPNAGVLSYDDGSSSFTSCSTTEPTGSVSLATNFNQSGVNYTYVMVDAAANTVINIFTTAILDLATQPTGSYFIYGVAYTGDLTINVGDPFDINALSSECSDVSADVVSFVKRVQDAGDVQLADGSTATVICAGDGAADELTFSTTYAGEDSFIYVITDDNNTVIGTSATGIIDFEGAEAGICRIWGLAFSGNLTVTTGDDLASGQDLSDECFDLSNNFVTIDRNGPEAGSISYADGSTSFVSCTQTEPNTVLEFSVSGDTPDVDYSLVVVDNADNLIAAVLADAALDLSNFPNGNFTIYGVSHTNDLSIVSGDLFDPATVGGICFDLSEGISLIRRVQDAGTVTLSDGTSSATVCVGDGVADELTFTTTYSGEDSFVYVITDDSNFVLGTSPTGVVDFEGAEAGICRVWGLAYSGNLTVEVGDNLGSGQALADECFDLSDGFVTINRNDPEAGTISYADGSTGFVSCTPVPPSGTLEFVVSGNTANVNYSYLIVDNATNTITTITNSPTLDIANFPNGNFTIYGLSHVNALTVSAGDAFDPATVGGNCFDLSNGISLIRRVQDAGMVSLSDGTQSTVICVGDGLADELTFVTTYTGDDNFVYVITDDNNIVLDTSTSGVVDFEGASAGICRVWGLAYSGSLTLTAGDDLSGSQAFSDECFDLSEGFVTINRNGPVAGEISFADGSDSFVSCTPLPPSGTLSFVASGNSMDVSYSYIIVDNTNNTIALITTTPTLDLGSFPNGNYTIFGLSHLDDLTVSNGDAFDPATVGGDCFALSNGISLIRRVQNADDVLLSSGADSIAICVGDGNADELTFTSTYAGEDNFVYIITNEGNFILETSTSGVVDFEGAPAGICRVWGLAYSGNLTLAAGDNLGGGQPLSDECFDLSDGFVVVNRLAPEGGDIALADGSNGFVSCLGTADENNLSVSVVGNNPALEYVFVLVDSDQTVVALAADGNFNAGDLANGTYEVVGLAYLAPLNLMVGDAFEGAVASDDCFGLSNNRLTITRAVQEAGTVTLADGSTDITICAGDGTSDALSFVTTATTTDNFIYVVTDESNFVLDTSTTGVIDFEGAPVGVCRVWGLAYSGNLTVAVGDNAGAQALSDECFDLSNGFVTVTRVAVDGGSLSFADGSESFISCTPLPPMGNVVILVDGAESTAPYALVIVDNETGVIEEILLDANTFDLATFPNGNFSIYGISYAESLGQGVGDVFDADTLVDGCADLADNVLTFIRRVQNADDVFLADGRDSITLCIGDGVPDELTFTSTYTGEDNFIYLITDQFNFLLDTNTTGVIDFEGAGAGICRVWGLAYTGDLLIEPGQSIGIGLDFSTECSDLSDGFVYVNRNGPVGGTIAFSNGEDALESCTPLTSAGVPSISATDFEALANYTYLIVNNTDGLVAAILPDGIFTSPDLANGTYTIYGLSYVGDLPYALGDSFDPANLVDCVDPSANTLTLIRDVEHADDVLLADGSTEATVCVGDDQADELTFTSTYQGDDEFVFIITDAGNFVLDFSTTGVVDFEAAGAGICRVWGLAYSGDLLVAAGDNLGIGLQLASECFDLSDGFVTVNRSAPDAGTLSFLDGSTLFEDCEAADGSSILTFVTTDAAEGLAYTYLVVETTSDTVIAITDDPMIDLSSIPFGTYEVYGLSYFGNLTIQVGDVLADTTPADICFDLSTVPLQIINRSVNIGAITFDNGTQETAICPDDNEPDFLNFQADYDGDGDIAYLITTVDNEILAILASGSSNFGDFPGDFVRIWAVAYTGNFFLQVGQIVDDEVLISDECSDVTDNFLLVDLRGPMGGTLSLADGSTETDVCTNDGIADIVTVTTSDAVAANYTYLVTDDNNIILDISDSPEVDFDNAPAGICRIWGLAYQGTLLAEAGQDAAAVELATVCFDLSSNFITVNRTALDGATVSLVGGETSTFACTGDDIADFFTFENTSTAATPYTYIVTDSDNTILSILTGNGINLDDAAPGVCRVWGLSYSGNIIAQGGQNAAEVALTDACFELSDNFVTITRDETDGGMVSLAGGGTVINICPDDATPDELSFANSGSTTGAYTYILTDASNQIISTIGTGALDFNNIVAPEQVRVWGLAFTGLPSIGTGDIEELVLSNRCFDLSDNFVTIIREVPEGGSVTTDMGASTLSLCTDDGIDDLVSFNVSGASNTDYVFLITDENNIIIDLLTNTNTANFEGAEEGICRVWGVAYTGTLLAQVGDDAAAIALSDDCFDLSDDFVTVIRGGLDAGRVITAIIEEDRFTCPGDGMPDIIRFDSVGVGANANYNYVLTDEDNIILELPTTDEVDFETLPEGVYRMWGLLYTGDLLATTMTDAANDPLATGCFDLSDNFINIINIAPNAGNLSTEQGDTITICIGDNIPDPFTVDVDGASAAAYTFLVVDQDSFLIGNLNDPTFDFENGAPGDWKIYGLSYTGSLSALPGTNIFTDQLASGCFELSSTFIYVDKTQVDGGALFTDFGAQVVYTCPDGVPDIVNFINSGTSEEDEYTYVLTTQNNLVLQILTGNTVDFEIAAGLNALRVWGVSYTGDLNLAIGNDIANVDLSTGCNVLSDNFVDVSLDTPEGGTLSFDDGTDSIRLCHSSFMPGVNVNTTSTSLAGYAYLITDEDNTVLEISEPADGFVVFDNVPAGTYRIWAISYTGTLLVEVGDDAATTTLASSCFELSNNFVTVVRTESLTGGTISDVSGQEVIYFCPGDDVADIVILSHESPDPNLRYIVTDDQNRILFGDVESNIINFDIADPGICRIYGISYTGEYNNLFMANILEAELSSDCWALTDNYLTIVREAPEGGTVATSDGFDTIDVLVGDGMPDEFSFVNTGAENAPYIYVITDEENVILGTSVDGIVDFESAGVGTCRVWGLSYTGNLLVGPGDDADEVALTDDCFDLSDNFVTVNRMSNGSFGDDDEEGGFDTESNTVTLNLYPNPATNEIRLNVTTTAAILSPEQQVQIYNLQGTLLMDRSLAPNGAGQLTIDIHELQVGVYLLRWFDGEQVVITQFMKL